MSNLQGQQLPKTGNPSASAGGVSRRRFLHSTALAALAAPLAVSCRAPSSAPRFRTFSENSKLAHASIGIGGMGTVDLQSFVKHPGVEVVALCDVDSNNLAKAAALAPKARLYADWRELLAKEGSKLDSVNVAVPDHSHYPIAYSALRLGKHVYCQKPMCHDVAEVRALTELAVKAGVVTQLGTQMASNIHERTAVQWLRQGVIGKITHAYLCSNRPGAVETYRLVGPRPAAEMAAPSELNWDLWLGTAPVRSYAPDIYHPAKWRAWQDFGTGWSGDIGCHIFDAVWKGLGLKPALNVYADVQRSWLNSVERRADTWPQGDHITWRFPGNKLIAGPELVLEWFDGEYYPPENIRKLYSADLKEYPSESAMLIGTEGALLIPLGYPPQLLPEEKFKHVERPKLGPRDHYQHYVDACLGGEFTESHFGQTGPMAEAILLGTVAIRQPGQLLEWDHKRMRITNDKLANRFLQRNYRQGWEV